MPTYVALLRGINVGGHGRLPMASLRDLLSSMGCSGVVTYIQSGNVVFDAPAGEWEARIADGVERDHGFRPRVMVMTADAFCAAADGNPYPTAEPKATHIYFLSDQPVADASDELESVRAPSEQFVLKGNVMHLHTPELLTSSRIAPKAERILGVNATQRNWRTIEALMKILDDR